MDYLIGDRLFTGLLVGSCAIPVTLPDPARFAVHKLVIAQERATAFQTKVEKDIAQATEIIEALLEVGREENIKVALAGLRELPFGKPVNQLKKSIQKMSGQTKLFIEAELA